MLRPVPAPRTDPALIVLCAAAALWAAQAIEFGTRLPALDAILRPAGLAALALGAALAWRSRLQGRERLAALVHDCERSRAIVREAGEVIVVIDARATIVTFNRAAERMFGYSAAEVVGRSLELLMTNGAREHHRAYLAEHGVTAMVEAARAKSVHKGVRKRGDVVPFELTMTEWRDGDRRMFTGVMRDVTEQERAAAALKDTKARYEAVYENFSAPMFTYAVAGDGGFVLESMNRAAEEFTGLTRFATIGRTPEEMAPGDRGRALRRALLSAMTTGEAAPEAVGLHTVDGVRLETVVVAPMHDVAGEVRRLLVSIDQRGPDAAAA